MGYPVRVQVPPPAPFTPRPTEDSKRLLSVFLFHKSDSSKAIGPEAMSRRGRSLHSTGQGRHSPKTQDPQYRNTISAVQNRGSR